MAIHGAYPRLFPTLNGSVMGENGRSLNLSKGQVGIFNINDVTPDGSKALTDFSNLKKGTPLRIHLGTASNGVSRTSNDFSWKSVDFTLDNIVAVKASKPERTEQMVDDVILGYNGVDASTSFAFELGQSMDFALRLSGEALSVQGVSDGLIDIPFTLSSDGCTVAHKPCEQCDPCGGVDCGHITMSAIQGLREFPIGKGRKLGEVVDILPVLECKEPAEKGEEKDYKFYCISLCDTGDVNALAAVQEQAGNGVVAVERNGSITSYKLAQSADLPAPKDFVLKADAKIKGCKDCPDGYTADGEWCKGTEGDPITWTECGSCKMSEMEFQILLPDTECGESRLKELQARYPSLVIEEVDGSNKACQRKYKTKVGTNVVCDECDEIFKDLYTAKAPEMFDGVEWVGETHKVGNKCLCGIRFRSKPVEMWADGCLADKMGFVDSSVRIQVSGAFTRETLIGINDFETPEVGVTWMSKWQPRTHMGGNLKEWERESITYFTGTLKNPSYQEQVLLGEQSHFESGKQYVFYTLTINRPFMSQGFAGHSVDTFNYSISAEVGKHFELEKLVNALATGAGLEEVTL